MPYGDRAYKHAKPRAPGEAENWTRETPPEVNDLRKQEYEKRLTIFKKKEGLQGISDLRPGRHEFKKGDTLYPILTKEFGMNRHTAFFAMVKLLENNVNVDLWRVGDEIELRDDGSLSLKRAGKEQEIKNILETKIVSVPEPAPAPPSPPQAGPPAAPPERAAPPPPPPSPPQPDAAPAAPAQPPPPAPPERKTPPPERGTESAPPAPAAPPPGEPPERKAPPERTAPPERGVEPAPAAPPVNSAPPERKAPPERGAEQPPPKAPAAPLHGAPPERQAPSESSTPLQTPAPAPAPVTPSAAPPERGAPGDIRGRSADAFKEAESGAIKSEVRAMSPEEKAAYEKLKKIPIYSRILSEGAQRFYRYGLQKFPIHIKSDYIEIRVIGKNARGFPRTKNLLVYFVDPQDQDPVNVDTRIKATLDRMRSE